MAARTARRRGVRRRRLRVPRLTKAQVAARVRAMFKPHFSVECYLPGMDGVVERKIERLVGKRSDGSGFSFVTQLRDVEFSFSSEARALAAAERVKAAKIRGLRIMMRGYWRA